jgi:Mg-chelatase subunit ChlD
MRRRTRALISALAVFGAAVAGIACGSDPASSDDDDDSAGEAGDKSSGGSSAGTGGAGGNSGGSPAAGGTVPVAGGISVSGSAGTGGITECAGEVTSAMQVPLDIYVMLDSSASMLEQVGLTNNKWNAVTSALATFLEDPQSEGIGVGLQFFPLRDPEAPETCTSNAACGSYGPCFLTFCENAGPDIFPCGSGDDCFTAEGEDAGPCVPLRYCWSLATAATPELVLCHNDSDCAGAGDCVAFNDCSMNDEYICPEAGMACGVDEDGMDLGECEAFSPESFCIHEASCRSEVYAAPEVDVSVLPDALADLGAAITAHMPLGNTPTGPALAGAIEHAAAWANDHPDHRVVVLLATDGLPTECIEDIEADPTGVDEVVAIAAAGLAGDPSITTYVIGVFPSNDTEARGNVTEIARAGGSENAFLVDTSGSLEEEFLAALDTIRGTRLACEFQIPKPAAGSTLDYGFVNVEFTNGGASESLFYVTDQSQCDAATGGWYYDVLPADGTPTKIIACPASCAAFQEATGGSVAIRIGCQTIVK